MSEKEHLVVIGNGMVGQRFVNEFIAGGGCDRWSVTIYGEERHAAYDRVALSSYFDGATIADLNLCDRDELDAAGVELVTGTAVEAIDRSNKSLALSDGAIVSYDHLVLATGSRPFVPPIEGADLPGCFVYRTIDDLEAIRDYADGKQTGIVVGGGLLGLEAANALVNLGLKTTVVEIADRLMAQQLDLPAANMLQRWVTELGIDVELGFGTNAIEATPSGLRLNGGEKQVEAEVVVFSAGIRPRDELAASAGLAVGERGGVIVDFQMCTSDLSISAVGEVACAAGRTYGLVGPGYQMAKVAAERLLGQATTFEAADTSTKLKLLGVDVATFGSPSPNDEKIEFSDPTTKVFRQVSVATDGPNEGSVTGGLLVGDVSNYEALHAMSTGTMASTNVSSLILPDGLAPATDSELPDAAQICSCNNVSRGAVKEAVAQGCSSVAAVKSETSAGTGCGGCIPGVEDLVFSELERGGLQVKRSLCEHFSHTRQELFDLIRMGGQGSWVEVRDAFGTGAGCAICRPVVGSILASQSNGYILDQGQRALQDTNDHSLANMQRNGTYSVVPRVPGGEITAEQLIEIGKIAEDFDLYVKITGAQRIDLFGAQLHELPLIWQRVIDAGMESGHAYGKALRTVKSCVGDTWCRYGVQDSVSMAIRIEERYRGLRAPHKLKSAVSGCTRECAEAQSKDFGVIATETGWNLYLAGNGGRVPRHAELFATDLNDEELIRSIDRFLMFYIRTADKLERTAPWFAKLDGGMDYLRSVIVDDALGICDELDADMAKHVDTYECEWSATLASPERLSHFVEFVNAPDASSQPVWIQKRGQRVPANG